jgi:hypothetical protein
MPTRTVEDQHRVRVVSHLCTDFFEMLVHRLGVDRWPDDGGADAPSRANGTKQMYGVMAGVSYHGRA